MKAEPRTFHWSECRETLTSYAGGGFRAEPKRRYFEDGVLRITPPLVLPMTPACSGLDDYLDELPVGLGRHLVILYQAGATSLGLFEGGQERVTKSFRRYVVRGKGRAQESHLKTKGKSRYGSRLRLQNARRLVEETNAKLTEWVAEFGAPHQVYYGAPTRLWPSLFEAAVAPPFAREDRLLRIPRDLPRPTTDVLRRTYRAMEWGRIEPVPASEGQG